MALLLGQCQSREQIAYRQAWVRGEELYNQHCSNCHQPKGSGLARLYPPLAGADFLENNFSLVLCGMKYGMEGEIVVNGIAYNQKMPGISTLTDAEVAQIATYIYNLGAPGRGLITTAEATAVLQQCRP
jgi:mono/diheme cytochrome c family protein